jgi:hypothetical protein
VCMYAHVGMLGRESRGGGPQAGRLVVFMF